MNTLHTQVHTLFPRCSYVVLCLGVNITLYCKSKSLVWTNSQSDAGISLASNTKIGFDFTHRPSCMGSVVPGGADRGHRDMHEPTFKVHMTSCWGRTVSRKRSLPFGMNAV